MEGSIIFYTYGSTLELNGQQFEAGRLTEDLLNLSPDDYHPLHERMVRIRTLSGHNIRRCIICGKYFMLKSGVHALYCEGACPHAPGYTCRQFGTVEVQKELAKNNPKVKAKLTAFSRITKDMQRGAISQEDARRAKDHVRDRLYDALRSPDISVEEFSEQISTAQVYEYCRITRVSKPRGRPPKAKAGGTHDQ